MDKEDSNYMVIIENGGGLRGMRVGSDLYVLSTRRISTLKTDKHQAPCKK